MKFAKKFVSAFALALIIAVGQVTGSAHAVDEQFYYQGSVYTYGGYSVGDTITSSYGYWSPTPESYTYQWYRGDEPISGARKSSYKVQGLDYGNYIYLAITARKAGFEPSVSISSGTYIYYKGYFPSDLTPVISGTLRVGETLQASVEGWPSGTEFEYQWNAGGYQIYGATGSTFQLRSAQKNKTVSVTIKAISYGYYDAQRMSSWTTSVKPSLPKVSWTPPTASLTGKNILTAKAQKGFDSTAKINRWCFWLDNIPLALPASTKGAYFYGSAGTRVEAIKTSSNCFTYTTKTSMEEVRLRIDVTKWLVGTRTISAVAIDTDGNSSGVTSLAVVIEKTAPTVDVSSPSEGSSILKLSATTTTHSMSAPIMKWCFMMDGKPIKSFKSIEFKNASGSSQEYVKDSVVQATGCFAGKSVDFSTAAIDLDTMNYTNGNHELTVKVQSNDGETVWWSDIVKKSISIRNDYIPTLAWASTVTQPTMLSKSTIIAGSIKANIPGNPSSIKLSKVDAGGNAVVISSFQDTKSFSVKGKFTKATSIKIEIYDGDGKLVLTETKEIKISPFVSMSKPRVTVTGSTISDKTTKTVALTVKSAAGQKPNCTASWLGGSKAFKLSGAKARFVTFSPSGSGTVTVSCNQAGLTQSKKLTAKY